MSIVVSCYHYLQRLLQHEFSCQHESLKTYHDEHCAQFIGVWRKYCTNYTWVFYKEFHRVATQQCAFIHPIRFFVGSGQHLFEHGKGIKSRCTLAFPINVNACCASFPEWKAYEWYWKSDYDKCDKLRQSIISSRPPCAFLTHSLTPRMIASPNI